MFEFIGQTNFRIQLANLNNKYLSGVDNLRGINGSVEGSHVSIRLHNNKTNHFVLAFQTFFRLFNDD